MMIVAIVCRPFRHRMELFRYFSTLIVEAEAIVWEMQCRN